MARQNTTALGGSDRISGKAYDAKLFRRLWTFVRPYKGQVGVSLGLMGLLSIFQLIQPLLVRQAVDVHVAAGDFRRLDLAAMGFLACLLGEVVARSLQMYTMMVVGQKVVFDLRMALFRHLQEMDAAFFDRNPVGRLITRLTTDVEAIEESFSSGVIAIVGDVIRLLAIMGIMVWLHWQLALITFSVVPVMLLVSIYFRSKIRDTYRDVRARLAQINAYLQENVLGIKVVKLFAQESRTEAQFGERNRAHRDSELRGVLYESSFSAFIEFMGTFATALILWWGGRSILEGWLTFGTFFAFFLYIEKFFLPLQDLAAKYTFLQSAMAASERVFDLLDTEPEIRSSERAAGEAEGGGRVAFQDVRFYYVEGEEILHGIDLKVDPGEKIALVGATGSGKTTVARLLTRLYEVDSGSVRVNGLDVRNWDLDRLRQRVGIVLQDPFLFTGTVLENIRLFDRSIPFDQVREAAKTVRADEFLQKLPNGYEYEVRERGANLSAGQRQLIAFARALVYDPEILVLDEATSSVDTETEQAIQEGLERLLEGRTALVIAHRLSTIRTANRILVFHKGVVREEGTHRELLEAGGIYARLYRLQMLGSSV